MLGPTIRWRRGNNLTNEDEKTSTSSIISGRRKVSSKSAEKDSKPKSEVTKASKPKEVTKTEKSKTSRATPKKTPRATKTTSPKTSDKNPSATIDQEYTRLQEEIRAQQTVIADLTVSMESLNNQLSKSSAKQRLGIFVDVPNLIYGIEDVELHMGKLLSFLSEDRQLVRAIAYCPISDDPREPIENQKFIAPFLNYDYRLVTSPLKRFADGSIKGNCDVEMTVDMLSMAERLDVITLVSGDADFSRAVEAVQSKGVRVEAAAFAGSTSSEIRAIADKYLDLNNFVDKIT